MSLFQWNDALSVGNPVIDGQHKRLFELADQLHAAMTKGHGREVVQQTLMELVGYTKHHFKSEEDLMLKNSYPEYREHKAEHDDLTRKVVKFHDQLTAQHAMVTIDILQFLRDWLINHIGLMDKKMGQYIRNQQPSRKLPAA